MKFITYVVTAAAFCLAVVGTSDAATFKIRVKGTLERFTLSEYRGPGTPDRSYSVTGPDDPVIEGYDSKFAESAFSKKGKMFLTEVAPDSDDNNLVASNCSGILRMLCGLGRGSVSLSGFSFSRYSDSYSFGANDSSHYSGTDWDRSWRNSLGDHRVLDGEDAEHTLTSSKVSLVPIPASLPLLAFGLGGLGLMVRRKRKAGQPTRC